MNLGRIVSTQKRAVLLVIALLSIGGLMALMRIPRALFPQTDFPRIIIVAENGVAPAQQTLVSVTRPIEEAMSGIPGIARIKSTTARGSTEVDLFFDWKTDIVQTLQIVQARVSQLASELPPGAVFTRTERLTFAVFPIIGYSITSPKRDPGTLRNLAEVTLRPPLARIDGVATVQVLGGQLREYHVLVDRARLEARGVSLQQVSEAMKNSNVITSPGLINENHQLELALVSGQATSIDDLAAIVVTSVNNVPVRIGDVASVTPGLEPRFTIVTADGRPAVLLNVLRQPTANILSVADGVKAEVARLKSQLPRDVDVKPYYDQSLLVSSSVSSVRDAILIGLILSVAILYGFLRNWGTTLVATLVIPITVLVTFVAMWVVGLSFDLMTLGGVAAAIGLVIDDAIVVVENIYTHMARGESRADAVHNAISEIAGPIIGSTITPVVVFLPLALLTGITGVFFRSLALTMSVALLTSLFLALTFTPVLAEQFIRVPATDKEADHDEEEKHGPLLTRLINGYEWLLAHALARRGMVLIVIGALAVLTFFVYKGLGSEFLPAFEEHGFILDYTAPPGASLDETDRMLRHVETMLKETPEVDGYSRRTGAQLGLAGVTEPNTGDFAVKLKDNASTDAVTSALRTKIESSEPALRVEFLGILSDLIGDLVSSPQPIEIRVFSEDAAALRRTADQIAASIAKVSGVVDVFNGIVISGPAVVFQIDPQRAAMYGVTAADVNGAMTTALGGDVVSNVIEHGRATGVRVLLGGPRPQLEDLRALPIRAPSSNSYVRIDQIATVNYDPGQTEIGREGLRQAVSVTGRLEGRDLGSAIAEIQSRLASGLHLPPGTTIEYGGLYQEQQSSFHELLIALGMAIALVFLVLVVEFRSFAHPTAIVAGAVLALSGSLAALLITHTTLNVVSMMGLIMIVGIVSKNGILMLDTVEDHLRAGEDLTTALRRSGRRRFRPVLMTSLAAMLGMLPLALALGSGSELLQPLAICVIGGLLFALMLSLVVTPTIYAMIRRETA
ncbi:MAG TPA: efflux RND transporter permease subunit [Thermoanaerobaculia bacterium]|jgi:CzcA family heavy metal efflux pump|nr:efflux RND transporter permease subunit [Thermoanaerobaculia bacterium]